MDEPKIVAPHSIVQMAICLLCDLYKLKFLPSCGNISAVWYQLRLLWLLPYNDLQFFNQPIVFRHYDIFQMKNFGENIIELFEIKNWILPEIERHGSKTDMCWIHENDAISLKNKVRKITIFLGYMPNDTLFSKI